MAKVNEKSTKTEIWAAYKELMDSYQAAPSVVLGSMSAVDSLGSSLELSRNELTEKFESALKVLKSAADDYAAAEQMINRTKTESIEELERSKNELQAAIDMARKSWDQEKSDHTREREREAEEYTYELNKKRRSEEEAFQSKWQAKFAELDSREAELKAKESRLTELEKMAEEAPTKLEEAVKQAKENLGKELQTAHAAEAKDARLQAEHQRSILELKLQTAEASIVAKDKQLAELQKQLDAASSQLKDMAVTVIRASNSSNQPVVQSIDKNV